mgnify:FL=1
MKYLGWELEFFDKANNYRKYQFDLMKQYIKQSILEVGPGNGIIMDKYIYESNLDIVLLETDKRLFEKISSKFESKNNVKVYNSKIDTVTRKFKTILYLDVIEHIENHEEEILKAYSKLENDGYLIVMVPSYQHLYSDYDAEIGHYRRFNKKFFKDLTKKNNIQCEKLIYFDCIGYFFLLTNKIIKLKKIKKLSYGTKVWNFLIPFSKILDKLLMHSFGKSLLCIYKKADH